ncbi:MAG: class I SAM-dependent methyltransferase [Planctomycetes bacterium]|nr:class I SAM-dependent methyltransferase [Planctomycetota bacterium]
MLRRGMGLYTKITRSWLESRFRRRSPEGIYFAHMPVYGIGTEHAEGNHLGRLARLFRILRELDGLRFESFLDVGGAEGYLAHLVRQLFGAAAFSADLSHEASLRARELFGLPSAAVDCARLPFADGAFDVVVCSEVIEHVEHPVETVLELQRVARRAVILTTEEVHFDRQEIADYLFRRPGWPHMERNLFHPDDLEVLFPGAPRRPQLAARPGRRDLPAQQAAAWLLEHTAGQELRAGDVGVVVVAARSGAAGPRRYDDARLAELLLATTVAPGARSPSAPDLAASLPQLREPGTGAPLRLEGDALVGAAGNYPVRDGVPDFVDDRVPPPSRDSLAERLRDEPPARRDALLDLRDRLFLAERCERDDFDFREHEQRRGFWLNDQLQPREVAAGAGFAWRATGPDPWLVTPCLQRPVREVELELRVHAPDVPVDAGTGQIFWKGPADVDFTEARSVQFRVPNDGQFHTHTVTLEGHAMLPAEVQWLRLDVIDGACEVDLRALRLR